MPGGRDVAARPLPGEVVEVGVQAGEAVGEHSRVHRAEPAVPQAEADSMSGSSRRRGCDGSAIGSASALIASAWATVARDRMRSQPAMTSTICSGLAALSVEPSSDSRYPTTTAGLHSIRHSTSRSGDLMGATVGRGSDIEGSVDGPFARPCGQPGALARQAAYRPTHGELGC